MPKVSIISWQTARSLQVVYGMLPGKKRLKCICGKLMYFRSKNSCNAEAAKQKTSFARGRNGKTVTMTYKDEHSGSGVSC